MIWRARRRALASLDDEMRDHIDREADENIARGMAPEEARRAARVKFGGVAIAKEDLREVWVPRWLDGIDQDVRLACRSLRAMPMVAAVAVLSLALGIGANTAIFSLVDGLVLRPLPVKEPGRLVVLAHGSWSNPIWEQIRQASLFERAFAWHTEPLDISEAGPSQLVNSVWTSGGMFDTLGVPAVVGRTLTPDDDRPGTGNAQVAVLSYAFWQRQFSGAPDVVGGVLTLRRVPFTIVGVTGPGFFGPDVGLSYDVAIPLAAEPSLRGATESRLREPDSWWLEIMARLRPGQSLDLANAALRARQRSLVEAAYGPEGNGPNQNSLREPFTLVPAANGFSELRTAYSRPLTIMLVVVGLVLLIACANVANLLLTRAEARRKDWSMRLALGATRFRLLRQLFVESAVLVALGGVAGVVAAQWGADYLLRQIALRSNPAFLDLGVNWRVLAFTLTIGAATTLLSGTASAFRASGTAPMTALKDAPRGASSGGGVALLHAILVGQVAFSIVLLVGAGLFVRTFALLATKPLGFDDRQVLTVTVATPIGGLAVNDRLATYERVRDRVASVPGVAAAGVSRQQLVTGGWSASGVREISGRVVPGNAITGFQEITPGWLSALSIPILEGRDLETRDSAASPRVALVNEAFVRTFIGSSNPLGQVVRLASGAPREIVGVVADAVYKALREPVPPTLYVPLAQAVSPARPAPPSAVLMVRAAAGDPSALSHAVAAAIADVNPDLSLTFKPLAGQVGAGRNQERLVATLSAFFGGLALALAALGLYGVTWYAVSRRRREIGIRMALGAQRSGIVRLVLSRVFALVGAGVLAGLLLSIWASHFVATLLYGIEPRDPASLAASVVILLAVTAVAAAIPASRASRIDPMTTLRDS